ncbi:DUF2243 domain-containing protein [Novosphingobium sp. RD2P27]|uniref:DUF2243 domain-containing protein n=1 Tax=Novosphingobium kalidii TaxID=3230299 RepID=A0ABV2CZ49_9SPHN
MSTAEQGYRRLSRSGYLLGFGVGGFFDGILLHQILQWHHLLSLVDGVGDIRNQVLFDGLFHALMYVIAGYGLTMLIRSRHSLGRPAVGRLILGNGLIGFGSWHVVDSVLSHWLLGIHRIRLDSPNPLFWDALWFALFGVLPIVLGALIKRRRSSGTGGGPAAAVAMTTLALVGGVWAARSATDARTAIAVFRPEMSDGQIFNAVGTSGGRVLWASRGVWAIEWQKPERASGLYGHGALLVSNSYLAAGCLAWASV